MIFDLVIIGAGPAGITASVYAARQRLKFMVIAKDIGGQAALSGDVENYTGYQFISGPELAAKFEEHMRKFDFPLKEGEESLDIGNKEAGVFKVRTNKAEYECKSIIIASGKKSKELGLPGEKEFKNKGVTYCAICDGPLFTGKDVAIIGAGNSALDAAVQMIKIARKVYIINIGAELGGDAITREQIQDSQSVTILNDTRITAILGEKMVSAIRIKQNNKQEEKVLPVQGVFIEIGLVPNAEFARDIEKNALGEITVGCGNETNIPGIFAAGDVTDVAEKQIIIAAGEGAKAALGAFKYLARLAKKNT